MPSRAQLEQLLAADPTDVFLAYAVAMACASEGSPDEAIDRLAALVEEHADYVPAWFQRGQLLASERRVQAARDVLTEGIAVARRVGDAHAEGEMTEFLESL